MKGKEIINHITQEKMPDIQQIREKCLAEPSHTRRGFKRLRLSTAAAIVAAFLLFATAAYAIADRVYQRVETGGMWDIVLLPDDEYGRQVYLERNEGRMHGYMAYWALGGNVYIRRINAEAARFLNEQLAGQLFTADGATIDFEPFVSTPGIFNVGRHHLDNRGYVLYTADGDQVGAIYLLSNMDSELSYVRVSTRVEEESKWTYNSSYEEVIAALGSNLRLPTAHIDMFVAPSFDLSNNAHYLTEDRWRATAAYRTRELNSIMDWCRYAMIIFIENERVEYGGPRATRYYLGGELTIHDIAGITVYELDLPDTVTQFYWTYNGLAYMLQPSRAFTPEQTLDVIRSMIE